VVQAQDTDCRIVLTKMGESGAAVAGFLGVIRSLVPYSMNLASPFRLPIGPVPRPPRREGGVRPPRVSPGPPEGRVVPVSSLPTVTPLRGHPALRSQSPFPGPSGRIIPLARRPAVQFNPFTRRARFRGCGPVLREARRIKAYSFGCFEPS